VTVVRSALGLAIVAALAAGCGDDHPAPPAPASPPPGTISKVTDTGTVKVTVEVWPPEPMLSAPIHLRLTAESRAGVAVDLPFQQHALGRFKVSSYDRAERRHGDTRIQVQNYLLEAPSSGRHRIPAFRLEVQPATAAGSAPAKPTEVLTEEIPLEVAEIDVDVTNRTLPGSRGPLPVEVGGWPWYAWVGIALGAVWLALGVVVALRLRKRRAVRLKISAYDTAVARLRALAQRGAPDAADADAWFVELSSIVRRYLEARYEIRAPELTTEEFLDEARRAAELTPEHRELLSSFMARCDRVKFAGYRPDADESNATLNAARGFVEDTRLRVDEVERAPGDRAGRGRDRRRAA
jgi:hypothetical protein